MIKHAATYKDASTAVQICHELGLMPSIKKFAWQINVYN